VTAFAIPVAASRRDPPRPARCIQSSTTRHRAIAVGRVSGGGDLGEKRTWAGGEEPYTTWTARACALWTIPGNGEVARPGVPRIRGRRGQHVGKSRRSNQHPGRGVPARLNQSGGDVTTQRQRHDDAWRQRRARLPTPRRRPPQVKPVEPPTDPSDPRNSGWEAGVAERQGGVGPIGEQLAASGGTSGRDRCAPVPAQARRPPAQAPQSPKHRTGRGGIRLAADNLGQERRCARCRNQTVRVRSWIR